MDENLINEILKKMYGLNNFHIKILLLVNKKDNLSVKRIASILNRERSTVQKGIDYLYKKSLVERKLNAEYGNRNQYLYFKNPKKNISQELEYHAKLMFENIYLELEKWKKAC